MANFCLKIYNKNVQFNTSKNAKTNVSSRGIKKKQGYLINDFLFIEISLRGNH